MKEISSMDDLSPRGRIAWRRAADELLIAAIFSEGVGGCADDADSDHDASPASITPTEQTQARAAAL